MMEVGVMNKFLEMKKLLFIILIVHIVGSCSKDNFSSNNIEKSLQLRQSPLPEQNHRFDNHPNTFTQTELGKELNNPFSVNNLKKALESLCDNPNSGRIKISVTDRQIKFKPKDYQEVKRLFRDPSLTLFDFPLNREVITMGDYYIDPLTQGNIPEFYTFVQDGQALPQDIAYEVIEEYDFEIDNPLLIAESFRLTDNFEVVNDYIFPEDIQDEVEICGKIMYPPDDIDCEPPCVPVLVIDDAQINPGGGVVYKWECDCSGYGGNGWNNPPVNDCGCPDDGEIGTPAGCITVQNTTTSSPEGVRRVRVILKDNIFGKVYNSWTDQNGCWQYTRKKFKGKLWMWIDFKNEYSFERCYVPGWGIIFGPVGVVVEYLKPINHSLGSISGPNFSNIEVHYPHWSTPGSVEQMLWGAATINNQVQIFNELATDINHLPPNLDIYMMPHEGRGSALMSSYGTLNALFGLSATVLAPDLMIGLNRRNRERQDLLSYHEMAHASHFTQVGPVWWEALIGAEVANSGEFDLTTFSFPFDPYGDGNGIFDGYIAVAESWAENTAFEFTGLPRENLLFENGYIPEGLYNDLQDINTTTDDNTNGIRDNVSGFTRGQLFDALTFSVTSIEDYRERLRPELPPINTEVVYNTLFVDYIP